MDYKKTYGIIETVFGALKFILTFGVCILMYDISAKNEVKNEEAGKLQLAMENDSRANIRSAINAGSQAKRPYAKTTAHSQWYAEALILVLALFVPADEVCSYVIPIIGYSFIGIEIVAVTAYEAYRPESLRRSSQCIAYVVFFLYLICAIADCLNVNWDNIALPPVHIGPGDSVNPSTSGGPRSSSVLIIATEAAGKFSLAGFLNACFTFSVLSAANTSLYASSRTLYGLARVAGDKYSNPVSRKFNKLSVVEPKTGVPIAAVIVSVLSFFWLPFLHLLKNEFAEAEVSVTLRAPIG